MIGTRQVLVFLARPEALGHRPSGRSVLAPEDLAHVARFHFEKDRQIALSSRVLQRLALSRCTAVAPDTWRFSEDVHGRPVIATPLNTPPLRFSVANTRGLVACCVTLSREIGIDVEPYPAEVPLDLIERYFSPEECAALMALPLLSQPRRFVELWTLKEAYMKARSLGLSLPLEQITVSFDGSGPRLALDSSLGDDAATWQLLLWSPTPSHAAALCVRRDDGPPFTIDSQWIQD